MAVWGVLYGVVAPFASVVTRSCVDGARVAAMVETTKKETEASRVTMHHMHLMVCVRSCGWYGETPTVDLLGWGKVLLGAQCKFQHVFRFRNHRV
jgi:hypothetical protein